VVHVAIIPCLLNQILEQVLIERASLLGLLDQEVILSWIVNICQSCAVAFFKLL